MLPLRVITGEAEARRAGISRPTSITFGNPSHSSFTDIDSFPASVTNSPIASRYLPRSMPSPPLAYDASPEIGSHSSLQRPTSGKFHGLHLLKHSLKTNLHSSSNHRSNPSSPVSNQHSRPRRQSVGILSYSSSSSKHSRNLSTNHAFADFGPKPPISPTPSFEAQSPSQSPVKNKFPVSHSHNSSLSSTYSRYSLPVSLAQSSPRTRQIPLDSDWVEPQTDNRNRAQRQSHLGSRTMAFEILSEASTASDGESASYTHRVQPEVSRAVYHYELTPESQQTSFPASPYMPEDISEHSDEDDTVREIIEIQTRMSVAPILQSRLSSMYSHSSFDSRDNWSSRSAAPTSMTSVDTRTYRNKFASMATVDSEMLELEEMMDDMNSQETFQEKEIRMLMEDLLNGEEIVRRPEDVKATDAIPSPQLPIFPDAVLKADFQMNKQYDWNDVERWATIGSKAHYSQHASSMFRSNSDIDDESMDGIDYRTSMKSRTAAEDEGLHEMLWDVESPEPGQSLPAPGIEVLVEDELDVFDGLGLGITFDDLSIVDEQLVMDMEEEEEEEEANAKIQQTEQQEEVKVAAEVELPNSRPSTKGEGASRPGTSAGPTLPILSRLEVPPILIKPPRVKAKTREYVQSSGEESPLDVKNKPLEIADNGRRHNLKENEIRVEDPAYLIAFKKFLKASVHSDAFVCRETRFDAMQTRRICNELPHEYRPLPPPPPNQIILRGTGGLFDDEERVLSVSPEARRAKEVNDEITSRLWVFMASKWLHYGRILISPAHDLLKEPITKDKKAKNLSQEKVRRRILDLGGAPVADWGWHCAYEYPHSKVYTVTSRPKNINIDNVIVPSLGVIEKRRFTGPSNHRHIKVSSLWKLPFPDDHFDVISARSLQTVLKQHPPARRRSEKHASVNSSRSAKLDEYALTLKECYRVLKPGGHLEFSLTDSDIVKAGKATEFLATEFGHDLRSRGYDPNPTGRWINRVARAGFVSTKRAWTILPMAAPATKPKQPVRRALGKSNDDDMKAAEEEMRAELQAWEELGVVKGNTKDVASVSGIVGTWKWEEWMLKIDGESLNPAGKKGLVNGITDALDEGRENGSGWRCLVGWTRKPTKAEKARMKKVAAKQGF